ncbi:unnamed protein product [Clonostachys rosea f. rosea IK726]|uniref:Uncharacterized protein n=1 Tax=Clonostachys rosea f. rosea IK726 TaxID=1349383 RepID=A0ACA9UEX8_BIOOC|nr:unnamed protein product [Clonostachys rosea f. rosea IK726]
MPIKTATFTDMEPRVAVKKSRGLCDPWFHVGEGGGLDRHGQYNREDFAQTLNQVSLAIEIHLSTVAGI